MASIPTTPVATSSQDPVDYLRSLPAIRARCTQVHELAARGRLQYFDYHPEKEDEVVEFCKRVIEEGEYSSFDAIPPHGRWRHFDIDDEPRIQRLWQRWSLTTALDSPSTPGVKEGCKRLLDLFLVSVLLDAGAGNQWTYHEIGTDKSYGRSEGLAIASLDMFKAGFFSGLDDQPCRVDAKGLSSITPDAMAKAMQVTSTNQMTGLDGRTSLLIKLSTALQSSSLYFGQDARPGNMLDYLEANSSHRGDKRVVRITTLWNVLIMGLAPIWPTDRTTLRGVPLGDVWPCEALAEDRGVGVSTEGGEALVPFHKLSQWLAYSLIEPIEKLLGWEFDKMGPDGKTLMTGLPEYRNGGLLVDLGVLTLKKDKISTVSESGIPRIPPSHPAIIEWRAMTVIELDRIHERLITKCGYQFSLPQILESATWKGGRIIAKKLRGASGGGPPIEIESDGTVF